jgi:DNA-binding transcriptional MerR regulator
MSEEPEEKEDRLISLVTQSGFQVVPLQTIIDALAEMERHLKEVTGITQEELEEYLEKIQNLLGEEISMNLSLEELASWIQTFQSL